MKHQIKNLESGTEKNQPIDPVAAAYAEKLKALKDARHISGMPLDFWVDFTEGLDHGTVARLCSRADLFPKYNQPIQPIDPVAAAYADWLQARKDWRDLINIEGGEDFSHPLQLEAQGREDAAADIMLQEKPASMMGFAGLAALAWCFNAPGEPKPEELPELAQSVDCGPILAIWRACTGKDGFPET